MLCESFATLTNWFLGLEVRISSKRRDFCLLLCFLISAAVTEVRGHSQRTSQFDHHLSQLCLFFFSFFFPQIFHSLTKDRWGGDTVWERTLAVKGENSCSATSKLMILEERSLHLSVSLSLAVRRIRWIIWSLLNFKAKHSEVYMLPDTDLSWRNTIQLADLRILIHIQFSVPGPPSHHFIAHYKGWEGKNKDWETRCKECISHSHSIQEIIASCCPIKHSDLAKLQWFKGEWMYTLNAQPNCFHEHSEDLNMKTHLFISSVCVFIRSIPTQDSVNR